MSNNTQKPSLAKRVASIFGRQNDVIEELQAREAALKERLSVLEGDKLRYRNALTSIMGKTNSEEIQVMISEAIKKDVVRDGEFLSLIRADLLDEKANQFERDYENAKRLADKQYEKMPKLWTLGFCEAAEETIVFLRTEADKLRASVEAEK